jgi:hypothetical protein
MLKLRVHRIQMEQPVAELPPNYVPSVAKLRPAGRRRTCVTFQELHQRLIQNGKNFASLKLDKRPTPIHEWQAIADDLTRPGDYTNLLLLP